jgi:hypothetical protein
MSSVRSPCLSTNQTCDVASSFDAPSRIMASRSWSAMPTPALPAPNTTSFCSRIGMPVTRSAASTAARLIAPVP